MATPVRSQREPGTLPEAPLLEAAGLTAGVPGRVLVRDLAFAVRPGEAWCVLGPNGSGKTTLLQTLAGLHRAAAGQVEVAGLPLSGWRAGDLSRVRGFLPQFVHDAFGTPVLDLVLTGRHPHLSRWRWESEQDRALALAALRAVELEDVAPRDATTLSGGERQRVAIAALLAQDPRLFLLDEPLAHLDLHHQVVVMRHFAALAAERGKALLFAIHDLNLARRFATHALLFMGRCVVRAGPVAEVMRADLLSEAFGYPVLALEQDARTVFVAA